MISGIIHVIRGGLMWRDAPAVYGPPKTLYNCFIRWSRIGVFDRIFATLAGASAAIDTVLIDVEPVVRHWSENHWRGHLKAHRTAASPQTKGLFPVVLGEPGAAELELHAICDGEGKPLILLLSKARSATIAVLRPCCPTCRTPTY